MNALNLPILSLITYLPLVGIVAICLINNSRQDLIRWVAFGTSVVTFLVSLPLYFMFDCGTWEMQFVEDVPWISQFAVRYHMGIDGISLLLVLLTTFLSALAILSTWTAVTERVKGYMASLLFLETGMIGVFCALDFVLFYVFWEVMLIPMYFIIGIWGGPRRIYAAVKFFIYTMSGSVLMLVAILVLYFMNFEATGTYTFDILDYYNLGLPGNIQMWLFLAFFVAFAIKVPMFPFHTWLPDAHVEAPTAGSVILAGVLLKMGIYGFLRFCLPIFPQATIDFMPIVLALSVVGIIYGAMVSIAQDDIKKLVAYSSVSHLGYCMLGMFALNVDGLKGSLIQMINHGLSTGALFMIVGMLYERRHTRLISEYGGIMKVMPMFAALFLLVALSSMGVPGLNGFVGELLILIGAFKASLAFGMVATIGLILGAIYLLWMYRRVMYGQITKAENQNLKDMTGREYAYLLPIVLFIVWIGVYPKPFLKTMDASVDHLLETVNPRTSARMDGAKPTWLNDVVARVDFQQLAKGQGR
ncbi:MAG: NADH dehydrogenase [Syntrophobacteraceae bacterium CG2_30_61_12]|nr:MAG: NADH dehydrogenase [Syntrophobacteraceae bacterium CG2_30_61_12]